MKPLYFLLTSGLLLTNLCLSQNLEQPIEISQSTTGYNTLKHADLDNDGDEDLIVSSSDNELVSWYPNLGGGNFGDQVIITHEYAMDITYVHPGDFDGDGNIDVVFCGEDLGVKWSQNLGGGNFGPSQTITYLVNKTLAVHVADINDDGNLDVLSASSWDDKIAWYQNNGTGSFSSQPYITTSANGASDVFAADLDNDGDLDVLSTAKYDDNVSWYENLGVLGFGPEQVISSNADFAFRVISADINNDGNMDVISASRLDDKVAWYENLGGGLFGSENIVSTNCDNIYCIDVADINGDGTLDILTASYGDDKVAWFSNSGTGVFSAEQTISITEDGATAALAFDNDGDGDNDVVVGARFNSHIVSYENAGAGIFSSPEEISSSADNPYEIEMIDVDNDGDEDVVCWLDMSIYLSGPGKIVWYENLNNGTFSDQQVIIPSLEGVGAFGYINDDNLLDYVSVNGGIAIWYQNLGGGNFSSSTSLGFVGVGGFEVFVSDCDNDGDEEIITATFDNNTITLFENLGAGTFGTGQIVSSNTDGAGRVCTRDIDNDGDLDILAYPAFDQDVALHENLGGLSFGPKQQLVTSAGTQSTGDADFVDLDGDLDLDIYFSKNDNVYWRENINGSFLSFGGTNQLNASSAASGTIYDVHCTDYDGDGDMDIFTAVQNHFLLYENLGNGVFGNEQVITSTSYNLKSVTSFDADNDGDKELLTASWDDDKILFYGNIGLSSEEVSGKVFLDLNNDAVQNPSEPGAFQIGVLSAPQGDATFTSTTGDFEMNFSNAPGSYTIFPQSIPYWSISTDSLTYTVIIDSSPSVIDSLWFGITPDSIVTNVNTDISASQAVCSSTSSYWLSVQNVGTTNPSGVICLELDPDLTFNSAAVAPDSIQGQNVYWSYDSLNYFGVDQISLFVDVPASTASNELMSVLAVSSLTPSGTVDFQTTDTLFQTLSCSSVAHLKTAMPVGVDSLGYVASLDQLTYTVYFQNTTNDTLTEFSIKDVLDDNLIWSSLSPMASSHPYQLDIDQNGEAVFAFENIVLPDSNSNYLGSIGFVTYSIDANPNLATATSVHNTAVICLPSNQPAQTNTTIHTIYDCSVLDLSYQTDLCFGDSLTAQFIENELPFNVQWDIPGVLNSTGNNLSWESDTSGVFNLAVSATNNVCSIDSTVSITIFPNYTTDLGVTEVCDGDSVWVFSQYVNTSGTYYNSLQSIAGCDSTVQMTVTMLAPINVSTAVSSDTILSANTSGANYQWLDCANNFVAIPGATSQSYTATSNGEYAVEITVSGCSDTSNCIAVSTISVTENDLLNAVSIYPNPSNGDFLIDIGDLKEVDLSVYSSRGEVIYQKSNVTSLYHLNLSVADGIYLLELRSKGHLKRYKLIKTQN